MLICDKGYAGREFAGAAADLGVVVVRPARRIKQLQRGSSTTLKLPVISTVTAAGPDEPGAPSRGLVATADHSPAAHQWPFIRVRRPARSSSSVGLAAHRRPLGTTCGPAISDRCPASSSVSKELGALASQDTRWSASGTTLTNRYLSASMGCAKSSRFS